MGLQSVSQNKIFHHTHPVEVLMVQWLGALAHSRKVAGSIPAHAIGLSGGIFSKFLNLHCWRALSGN